MDPTLAQILTALMKTGEELERVRAELAERERQVEQLTHALELVSTPSVPVPFPVPTPREVLEQQPAAAGHY